MIALLSNINQEKIHSPLVFRTTTQSAIVVLLSMSSRMDLNKTKSRDLRFSVHPSKATITSHE